MKRGFFALLLVVGVSYGKEIQILSAVKKDTPIANAKVMFQKTGEASVQATSNSRGIVNYSGFSGIDSANTMMIIKKSGYSTLIAKCPCDGFTYALSPEMTNLDGMRIVLTWGYRPKDLDSHLVFPNNHIFYAAKKGSDALLDVDDTSSYGPETITIFKKQAGKKYVYAVHDYSDKAYPSTKNLGNASARVEVYIGKTLIRTYKSTPNKAGNTWLVFGIDENGAFKDINQYIPLKVGARDLQGPLNEVIQAPSFTTNAVISAANKKEAKRLNALGEKVYHKKQLEKAMYLFQDAINLYPEFGQAYSNLGLTYQKLGRYAEALYANRKAIERAHGKHANIVKASSYYNIAKIYEKQGKWEEALEYYKKALNNREHPAYHKGIQRMEAKLGTSTPRQQW